MVRFKSVNLDILILKKQTEPRSIYRYIEFRLKSSFGAFQCFGDMLPSAYIGNEQLDFSMGNGNFIMMPLILLSSLLLRVGSMPESLHQPHQIRFALIPNKMKHLQAYQYTIKKMLTSQVILRIPLKSRLFIIHFPVKRRHAAPRNTKERTHPTGCVLNRCRRDF